MANFKITFLELSNAVTHALSGTPNANNPASQIVNRAVDYLVNMRSWRWRQKLFSLDFASVTITSLVRASGIVTVTCTSHGVYAGQAVRISGTAAASTLFDGVWTVSGAADANHFTFTQNAGPDEAATSPGVMFRSYIALPADFGSLLTVQSAANSFRCCQPASMQEVIEMRQFGFSTAYVLWYAESWIPQLTVTSEPAPCLEIYPTPTAAFLGALQGVYLRRLPTMSANTDMPDMPGNFHSLLMTLCRAFAVSTEEQQSGEDWAMFNAMLPTYAAEDGFAQGSPAGRMRSQLSPRNTPVAQFYPNGRITTN